MARGITLSTGRASGFDLPRAEEEVVSLASSFDTDKETFEPRIPVREEKRPTSTSSPSLTLAGVPEYETPEESLNNLASFVEQQQGQSSALSAAAVESGDYSGIKGADVNKLRQDPRNVRDYYTESVDTNIVDFVEDNDIPLFKEVNGQKLYLNTGTSGSVAGIAKEGSDVVYQAYGPVGTYSAVAVPKDRSISGAFPPIVRMALYAFTAGTSEAVLSAANAASGETLTFQDWVNLATGAYQLSQLPSTPTGTTGTTGTTAPRTPAEMAADGDIVSAMKQIGADIPTDTALGGGALSGTSLPSLGQLASAYGVIKAAIDEGDDDNLAATIAAIEAGRDFDTGVADPVTNEVVDVTGVTPETPPTPAPVITPEIVSEPIVADPPETEIDIEQPEVEQPEQQPVQQPSDSNSGGGADTGGGETGAGSSGTGIPEEGSGIPGTSGSGGIAQEEGYDPDLTDTMSVPNPDFDPESRDVLLQRQIYDAILRETDPVLRERLEQEYERMGGNHLEEVRAGVPREEVYADYPPEYIEVPYEEATLDEETFEARYPDGWVGGSFDTVDANKDGVISETELYDYEHNMGSGQGGEPSNIVKEILDALRLEVDTPDPSTGLPTDSTVEVGTAAGSTDPAVGTGQDPSTDLSTGIPSDTTSTSGTTGAGGDGVGTDVGGGAGGGTTGGGAGSGEAETGAGAGEGEGNGEGSGTGSGSGSGSGGGSGSGIGTGVGAASGTRTTDSLFGDMLQLSTQIGATQELINPFTFVPVPSIQQAPQLGTRPPGMLTNSTLLQRYRQ